MTASRMRYAVLLGALLGCSSSEFTVAGDGTNTDTGASADTAAATDTGTAVVDSDTPPPADSGSTADSNTVDASAPCAALPMNPPIVYVDKRTTKSSKGTSDCPFATIKEAVAFVASLPSGSGKHTIRVAGGAVGAPLVYDEPMLVLKWQMSLVGDGQDRVTITGGGTCGEGQCMVVMEGGSTLEGVKLDAKGLAKVPLALGPTVLTNITVKSTAVVGTKDDKSPAIYVDGVGTVDLGPDMRVTDNGGPGLVVKNVFSLKITGSATPNQFNRNLAGIYIQGGRLDISGPTEVSKNRTMGVAILAPEKAAHVLDGLIAVENAATGVFVDGGASLKLRRSRLTKNDIGLVFRFVGTNELDLGTLLDPGNNYFVLPSEPNKRAGICLPAARATSSPARSNYFSACPPTDASMVEDVKACDTIPTTYKDIYFAGAASVPLDLTNCGVK